MYQEYIDKKAGDIAERDFLVMEGSVYIADAARAMREEGVSSLLVSMTSDAKPVGIITERDILYRLVADNRSPFKTVLKDIMSSPLITIDESVTVKDAIILMRKHSIRRIPVTKEEKIIGLLTLKSVVGDSHKKSVVLAEVEQGTVEVECPYCGSRFDNKDDLSNHIDRLHLGSGGLLEGDLRQW